MSTRVEIYHLAYLSPYMRMPVWCIQYILPLVCFLFFLVIFLFRRGHERLLNFPREVATSHGTMVYP
ncbi:hypothetical protein BDW42DRAFT_163421 [Aspergillus taichungensis]|uniref:Uncharacterized protein n=1 Tax=Aspergillus taichungensis TaxID=482145 RepID=A0A2J5I2E6_9EURO|nr:hypothetical protein BDW42DRAFT_163421 [Aspergillus taichungensis]